MGCESVSKQKAIYAGTAELSRNIRVCTPNWGVFKGTI